MCFPKSIWLLRILRYPSSHVVAVQNKLFDDKQKVDNTEVNLSRIYIWNCFVVKNDVLISVLSVSAIISVLSALSAIETLIKLVCNMLVLTDKQIKPQVKKALTNLCYLRSIYSLCYPRYPQWKIQLNLWNILTLTVKQVCYPSEELDCTLSTVFPYFSLKFLKQWNTLCVICKC